MSYAESLYTQKARTVPLTTPAESRRPRWEADGYAIASDAASIRAQAGISREPQSISQPRKVTK